MGFNHFWVKTVGKTVLWQVEKFNLPHWDYKVTGMKPIFMFRKKLVKMVHLARKFVTLWVRLRGVHPCISNFFCRWAILPNLRKQENHTDRRSQSDP